MATCWCKKILRRWPVAAVLLAACCASVLVSGCGSPQQRYRVLSFFFDGVPNPDAATGKGVVRSAAGQTFYIHKPFADEKCDACHQNSNDIFARAQVSTAACANCHAPIVKAYPVMHGPVASMFCLKCHEGHQSTFRYLLKDGGSKLCTQCHSMSDLSASVPSHRDVKTVCINCHSGHGGATHKLLKASIITPATLPATLPVPEPATVPAGTAPAATAPEVAP